MSLADNPIFHDATAAREWLEKLLWPEGPICPHCGLIGAVYALNGKSQRAGLYKCKGCTEQFTVTVGTVFERSHIPLNKWVLAFQLMVASKKGMSAHQLHRMLGVTYKTAWFMAHRIREALVDSPFATMLGGYGEEVRDPHDIAPALQRARESGKPSLINVWVDPEAFAPGTMNQTMYK